MDNKRIKINGAVIRTKDDLFAVLNAVLPLENEIRNLDALHDELAGRKITLMVRNAAEIRSSLGEYGDGFLTVLTDTAGESEHFRCVIKE